ncbi:MAG: aminomethyl-transferring glycine dehydrogenase subunit GcvPB, partial [Desulfotignum sp.]
EALIPFLPVPRVEKELDTFKLVTDCPDTIGRMHTFYGHFGVMIKAYAYILSMGARGLLDASRLAVLNANYIKDSLKDTLNLPYDRPCMHECVFNDARQKSYHITTMDMAKRLLDYGFHPPTVYFPLVVEGAFMVEPTETESKDDIDQFINAVKAIAKEAESAPEKLTRAPVLPKVTRLDEVSAARKPCLRG